MSITCRDCNLDYPIDKFPYICPDCGGLFGFQKGLRYSRKNIREDFPGIWRFIDSFSLPEGARHLTLGEGSTPLVWSDFAGKQIGLKLESLNPTGSFKDRGTAVLLSWLMAAGITSAVEDSSGNAGASFAAYASRAGIQGKVFVPAYASGPKRIQIEEYGADVISVPGPRSNAAEAVLQEVKKGAAYASHAYLPHGTAGIATIAFELAEGLQKSPGTVIMPVGHGSLLLGIALGFEALLTAGEIKNLPRLIGVQAANCAPLWKAFQQGSPLPIKVDQGQTAAEGVAITDPYHGKEVIAAVRRSSGAFLKVDEQELESGRNLLAKKGMYVEPTSALVHSAIQQIAEETPEPIVAILTGHGLKSA
jgi:threonine synthase